MLLIFNNAYVYFSLCRGGDDFSFQYWSVRFVVNRRRYKSVSMTTAYPIYEPKAWKTEKGEVLRTRAGINSLKAQ